MEEKVSIIVLTKNEEQDIGACLRAAASLGDLHVLDSGSDDGTVEIARRLGASVLVHPFESFGQQRNYALDHCELSSDWVLFLDADEIATESFCKAVREAISSAPESVAGFYCCWKMMLEEVWLKRCDNFPKWQFRLLRKGRARFTDFGHGQKEGEVDGELAYLREPYLHYGFSKGWSQWLARHNKYSTLEAKARLNAEASVRDIFSSVASQRNPALKVFLSRLPGWPLLRFGQAYFLKMGFLEGMPGFIYCANMGYYEFLIQIKMREFGLKEKKSLV